MDNKQKSIVDILKKYRPWEKGLSVRALLMDCIPQDKMLINVLVLAYDEGICDILRNDDNSFAILRCLKKLTSEYGLSVENARWSIDTWCNVFEVTFLENHSFDVEEVEEVQGGVFDETEIPESLKKSNRYTDMLKQLAYIDNNGKDVEAVYALLSLCYGILVNPSFEAETKDVLWLANECLNLSQKILKGSDDSKSNRYRRLRIKWNLSFFYIILGRLSDAYENYKRIISDIDRFYIESQHAFSGGCFFMFYMAEINMHILAEMVGINDEDFYIEEKEERKWFSTHSTFDFDFNRKDGWMFASVTIRYEDTENPFYTIYDESGGNSSAICYNLRTTKIHREGSNLKIVLIPMGNVQFNGEPPITNWEIPISKKICEETRKYIINNKYVKGNNYIHNVCGFDNASH